MPLGGQPPIVPRNRYILVLAVAALLIGVLETTHLVKLPFDELLSGTGGGVLSTSSLLDFMRNAGYVGLFVLMALESASLPIPSEVVLPFAGYLVYLGAMDFTGALAVATAASLAGALFDYYLARFLGRPFVARMLKAFGVGHGGLDRAEVWFERSGRWTVFAARFVPALRTVISLPAGLFRMGLRPFVLLTTAGCLAWSAALIYAGYLAGPLWDEVFSSTSSLVEAIFAGVAAVAALYVAYFVYGWYRGRGAAIPSPSES
ncbi:MAG: DedA family protein [Thaumarchaeota archaeon]|nr:DedA family protein [Nitrososphaerota archaeon]